LRPCRPDARQRSAGENIYYRALADIVSAENDQVAQPVVIARRAADLVANQSIDQHYLPTEPGAAEKTAVGVAFVKLVEIVNDPFQRFVQHGRTLNAQGPACSF